MVKFLSIFLLLVFAPALAAQTAKKITINEFLVSNVSIDADIVDFDDYSDWIELYNDEDSTVDLSGYYLTDDLDQPWRWQIPPGTEIPAKGFLRFWADGYDDMPGKTYRRPYYPFDYFTTRYYHLNFSLSRAGETIALFAPDSTLVDSVSFGQQLYDVSIGRQPDGTSGWYYFGEPTTERANTTAAVSVMEYTDSPTISLPAGFYSGSQTVEIQTGGPEQQIRYTLDGAKAGSTSAEYQNPLLLSDNTVLRTRIFEADKLPGDLITRSYFIDEEISLPVISIVADPYTLWDDLVGIYANTHKEREIPIHFELFDELGTLAISQNAGLRLTGQLSLNYAQKSFTISARERYGNDIIEYQIFPERELNLFTSIYLRNSGLPDNQDTFFRDALAHKLVLNRIDIDCQAYRPSVLFLNGAYWGIYNIRDKINADYLASLHNLNPADIDLLEYTGGQTPEVMEGNAENFTAFRDYYTTHDLAIDEHYRFIESWMDIDEYINYQICEIYYDNVIWPDQNVRLWRERQEDKKWRWIIFDIDFGLGMPNPQSTGYTNNTLRHATSSKPVNNPPGWSTLLFRKLLDNQEFKIKFIQRFACYLNTIFHPDTAVATLNRLQDRIKPEMQRHINRWRFEDDYGIPIPDYFTWLQNVEVMRRFLRFRPEYQRDHIIDYFGLAGLAYVNFSITATDQGSIIVNDTERVRSNDIRPYFKNIPIRLEAIPEIGYRFVRWTGIADSMENPVTVNFTADTSEISALFEEISVSRIPERITVDTTLSRNHSPYYAMADITVDSGATLRMEDGVELRMPEKGNLMINGRLIVTGIAAAPVIIRPNEISERWGALCFVNTAESSSVNYLTIYGATHGPDFTRDRAAISGYNSDFSLDHVTISACDAPVFVRYGNISITNCTFLSDIAGDLINIKQAGWALVGNCDLKGNNRYDSDAIDYDQLEGGIIRGNRIYNFYGFNSDAIDLGEGSREILIEKNIIYNINDKGISIGNGSTGIVRRNLIANCGQGSGIKDYGSHGYFEHNTFYANQIGIASFEKNIGHGGGSAEIVNCIFDNSRISAVWVDPLSVAGISYSLCDTEVLPGLHNIYGNTLLLNNLYPGVMSPAIDSGNPTFPADPDGSLPDMGALPFDPQTQNILINEVHYHPSEGDDREFIELYNFGQKAIHLNGWTMAGNITHNFGDIEAAAGEFIVIAKNKTAYEGQNYRVFQWDHGALPDGAGSLYLKDAAGNTVDFLNYDSRYWWPQEPDGLGPSLELQHPALENMVSTAWRSSYRTGGTPGRSNNSEIIGQVYINEFLASNRAVNQDEYGEYDDWIELYNAGDLPVNLGGLYVTDDLQNPCKFQIPLHDFAATTIPPKGYQLLWADSQTGQGILHLSFNLNRDGEQIGLAQVTDSDTFFIDSLSFTEQLTDVSYGRYPDGSSGWHHFDTPTPLDSNIIAAALSETDGIPASFSVSQNYPNPFNPLTRIRFSLPRTSEVSLTIYDILGRIVAQPIDGRLNPGSYEIIFDATGFASGVYFYRLETPQFVATKKMVLLR